MRGRKQCDCGFKYISTLNDCPSCHAPEWSATFEPFNPLDWVYDLETYPNICTFDFKHLATGTRLLFEMSDRKNESVDLYTFLQALATTGCRMVGFNNLGFDYPIVHYFIDYFSAGLTHVDIYNKSQQIINTSWANRYDNVVWERDVHITQIDLFKIHHFDNDARRTSLKMIEFNMCMDSVEDLPYTPGTVLNNNEKNVLIGYNHHDVDATELFLIESIEMIEFREQLSKKYNSNYLNHNDKKIGTSYLINELERLLPGSCYTQVNGRKAPRQTLRSSIALNDVIFPYIAFKEPEFERVRAWLSSQVITETKGVFNDISATIHGFKYCFGTGGIHGSISSTIVESDDDFELWDWDVASFYPQLAIQNKLFPEHLTEAFCSIYLDIYNERLKHKKGTALNRALKLALNGAYGDSNSKYSPFYDPKFTMSITINGQLLLCMLAQYLIDIPGLTMVQINTDGMTVRCPRGHIDEMKRICKWWEGYTCLELESVIYNRMFIRDVNNYIAEKTNGGLKRKGAYAYERITENPDTMDRQWHQNHSSLVIPKAAEAALVHGQDIRDFIINHDNIFDFMLRTKVNRADDLILTGANGQTTSLQKITRYYISTAPDAGSLTKVSPPTKGYKVGQWKRANGLTDGFYSGVRDELRSQVPRTDDTTERDVDGILWDERINTKNRSKYDTRRTGFNVGYLVKPCNNIHTANRADINIDYYVAETEKLVSPLRG